VKIVQVSHYALPHQGGIEVVVDALALELTRRGHEVVHVASACGGPGADAGYRVVRVPALNALERRLDVPYPLFAPQLIPALRRELRGADVVHCHGLLYQGTVAALLGALLGHPRTARVVTEHVGHVPYASRLVDAAERAAIASVGRASARLAQAIVVLNDRVAAEVAHLASSREIVRIPNGTDLERYRPAKPGERERLRAELGWDGRPRVLFVGRLVEKKGVGLALAAARAAAGAFDLVLAGPGPQPAPAAHVQWLGPQPRERVADLYRAADAFLLPSTGEGFPLTAQEALASGLPVVLREDPAYAGYESDALVLAPGDGQALAGAVERACRDHERLGARATALAREQFSWSRAADAHIALYERIASAA
jgi:D-inositol-3-phosphate glycosyltransferase